MVRTYYKKISQQTSTVAVCCCSLGMDDWGAVKWTVSHVSQRGAEDTSQSDDPLAGTQSFLCVSVC